MEQRVDELNRCATKQEELLCAEYSFKLTMNPCQHPELDKNVHHLFTLVTSLCNTCGGVIFLTADDPEMTMTREVIERFQSRLVTLIVEKTKIQDRNKINFLEAPFCLERQGAWAAIHLSGSKLTQSLASGGDVKLLGLRTDLHGFIRISETSDHQPVEQAPSPHPYGQETLATGLTAENVTESDDNGPSEERSSPTPLYRFTEIEDTGLHYVEQGPSHHVFSREAGATGGYVETITESDGNEPEADNSLSTLPSGSSLNSLSSHEVTDLPVDVYYYDKLDWSKNKKDWASYVHGEMPEIETTVNSCSLWKPTKPMAVTPDKAMLEHWFPSLADMEETLSAVATKEPGFAVVCKTWKFHISNTKSESRPPGHICDILTASKNGRICFWVVCVDHNPQNVGDQIGYLLSTGRMIKYRLAHEASDGELSNLFIECNLFCPKRSAQRPDAVMESLEMQNNIKDFRKDGVNFESLQRALALVILSKESPLQRPVGKQTSITLSLQQLEVLRNNARVNYVCGPAGSGKSYTAALLCQMHGRNKSAYICTTTAFVEYLKFSGYKGTLVQGDDDLVKEIKDGTFNNKKCIIIDDSHNFACTKLSLRKLFRLMKDNKAISLYVFADNKYQAFDEERQKAMHYCIRQLSQNVLGEKPHYIYLKSIYRNTRKVVSFLQSAIEDSYDDTQKVDCRNVESGDGIEYIRMSHENDIVEYLHDIRMSETYKLTEIAVLLDPSFTEDHIERFRAFLREHLPNSGVQSASIFPRNGVVVDSVNSFVGLDAPLCVFILPCCFCPRKTKVSTILFQGFLIKKRKTKINARTSNPHFLVFMASRATHRAVFVGPTMDADIVKELKFDLFEVGVRGSFGTALTHTRGNIYSAIKNIA